jgi:hypothetical protein
VVATTGLYQLNHKQTYLGEDIENVYFFRREDAGTDHVDLIDAFIADVLPAVQALQAPQIITASIKAQSLGNLSDFGEQIVNTPGTYDPSEILPIFNAIGYTFRSANRGVRPGSKRITGIPETVQAGGIVTLSVYLTRMEACRVAMDSVIGTSPGFFTPIIVKRIKTAVPGTTPVKYKYTLPAVGDDATIATFLGVFTSPIITHQVSRGNWGSMAAVPYVTLNDLVDNVRFQMGISADLSELSGLIHDYQITHTALLELALTPAMLNALLKALTGCMVGLNADVNCYPVGAIDVICFDLDGNPV